MDLPSQMEDERTNAGFDSKDPQLSLNINNLARLIDTVLTGMGKEVIFGHFLGIKKH